MDPGPVVVLCLTLVCFWPWAIGNAQDFTAINNKLHQVNAYQKFFTDKANNRHLETTIKSVQNSLEDFWLLDLKSLNLESLKPGRNGNITAECTKETAYLQNTTDPTTGLPLIAKMIDAMGKIGPGYIEGNIYANGAYDECLDNDMEYCVGYLTLLITKPIPYPTWRYDMCVPRGCTPNDIMVAVYTGSNGLAFANSSTISCVSTRKPAYNAGAIIMILVCSIFVTLVMAATVFDFVLQLLQTITTEVGSVQISGGWSSNLLEKTPLVTKPPTTTKSVKQVKLYDFITAFSLFKVLSQILSTKQPPFAITSINGLRVMSIFWVILGHTHLWVLMNRADNTARMKSVLSRFTFQVISNATFSVDTFFFLSGLLVAYLSMREMKRKNGRFPFLSYYLHRYLRLTPTYAFVIFFSWLLMMHLADGPTYHLQTWEESSSYQNCKKYWWTNLLYINNMYPWKMDDECIPWTWYLANDMQFYIFSPLILIPLYFLFPLGLVISAIIVVVSLVVSGALAGVYDYQANGFYYLAYKHTFHKTLTDTTQYNDLLYIKPWHRVAPYIVGLILGYVLYRFRPSTKRYIYYPVFLVMWILSGIFLMSTLYGLYFQWHGHVPKTADNVIYITFTRFTWSLGLALLVFSCHYGYGGPINQFLSMKFWIPLSRVSYNAYLLHPLILNVIFGSERKVMNYQDYNLAIYAIGITALSFGAAAIVCVFVEFPISNVEQALFKLVGLGRHESARTGGEEHQDSEYVGTESSTNTNTYFENSAGSHNST